MVDTALPYASSRAAVAAAQAQRKDTRNRWLLSAPALIIIAFAAVGPLFIMAVYSFLTKGPYGGVIWEFSTDGWYRVLFETDIFDETVTLADAHLSIFWRSLKLSTATTLLALVFGFPTAYFIATRSESTRAVWLFLITIFSFAPSPSWK
jgi:spermidine/putrescine transport system permease protein